MAEYTKPLPIISPINQTYWDSAKKHALRLQRCNPCERFWYPNSHQCPHCWSRDYSWEKVSGRGTVNSWVVFHQRYYEGFKDDIPYNVVQVELEEGPRIISSLVGVQNEEITMGMRVEVIFEDITKEITLPKFQPLK